MTFSKDADSARAYRFSPWLGLSVVVIVMDQVTKYLAVSVLALHEPVAIGPFLNFTLTYNPGAAFSFLGEAGGWQRWLFAGISVFVSTILIVWLNNIPRGQTQLPTALSLVLGGAIGNLWDRLVLGEVVDFLDVYYGAWHWPAFNIADSAITVGAVMLFVSAFSGGEASAENGKSSNNA